MSKRMANMRSRVLLVALCGLMLGGGGCGYLKNVRDDVMDIGSFAVGYVPPVAPLGGEMKAVGPIPPAFGVYVEATEFLHLGFIYKATADLEWDRRGLQTCVDIRRKIGVGPLHSVRIKQIPLWPDTYKDPDSPMQAWRDHMDSLRDPVFGRSAKTMIYKPDGGSAEEMTQLQAYVRASSGAQDVEALNLPYLYRGWQDWETFSVELAVPEPFILHSGFAVRASVDPSQVLDLALSLLAIDLYGDSAYKFWSGDYKYLSPEQVRERAEAAAAKKAEMERRAEEERMEEERKAAEAKAEQERKEQEERDKAREAMGA